MALREIMIEKLYEIEIQVDENSHEEPSFGRYNVIKQAEALNKYTELMRVYN